MNNHIDNKNIVRQKALEIINKYVSLTDNWVYGFKDWEYKKQCAIVTVTEIIEVLPKNEYLYDKKCFIKNRELIFWEEVLLELQK